MYHPAGSRPFVMVRHLSIEFVTEFLEALLVVFLLSQTRLTSFGARVEFVTVAGDARGRRDKYFLLELVRVSQRSTPAAYMLIQVVGFFCVGLVAALVLKNQTFAP